MADFPKASPVSYNGTEAGMDINIQPGFMYDYAHRYLPVAQSSIVDAWNEINRTWANLRLGWIGSAAESGEKLKDQLMTVQDHLFGKKDGDPGILHQVRSAALMAVSYYDAAESYSIKVFDEFLNDLTAPPSPGAHPPQDIKGGPISIDYNNGPGVRYDNREVIGQYMDQHGNTVLLYEGDPVPKNDNDHTIATTPLVNGGKPGEVNQTNGKIDIRAATWKDEKGNWHYVTTPGDPDTNGQPLPKPSAK
ncbi:hypothetical protein [Actinoplanes sp. NPDC049265]|uniref:hypothetical protein n=1 Tax=Actinoplanes sp. NPDC049265 TaxID=3363902 RepID=UPI00371B7F67